jgi:CheY-like chemotaxis protein
VNAPQIQQVLLNLLNNAQQAIEKNDGSPGVIKIEAGRRGDDVFISIADNGKGIPQEVMPFIFDPFFTTKGLGEGAGLGLSIVHTMIENHGGRVSVKSIPRQTVFTIELPLSSVPATTLNFETLAPQPSQAPEPTLSVPAPALPTITPKFKPATPLASASIPPALPPASVLAPEPATSSTQPSDTVESVAEAKPKLGRVLVVDDEKAIVGAVCDFMEMMDITTHQAYDGVQAMALLQTNRYDAIISDIRMPNMDGKQLFAEAVKLEPAYQTRFIFMSGDLIRDTTQAFVKTITCPFLAKPFALYQMHKLVVPHLDQFSG